LDILLRSLEVNFHGGLLSTSALLDYDLQFPVVPLKVNIRFILTIK